MIDKTEIITAVTTRLKSLPVNHYLDIRTYKRNRSVIIVKRENNTLLVIQNGYTKQSYVTTQDKLKKLLKTLLKKEFPRSNKVRLYTMDKYDKDKAAEIQRKII